MAAPTWTIEGFCESQSLSADWLQLPISSRLFLQSLGLPSIHPFCDDERDNGPFRPYELPGVPSQGPLQSRDHLESPWDVLVTTVLTVVPSLAAMAELWLRLFASVIAPAGIAYLLYLEMGSGGGIAARSNGDNKSAVAFSSNAAVLSTVCLLTVATSIVILTDTLYVLEYGPMYGMALLASSSVLAFRATVRHGLRRTAFWKFCLLLLAVSLVFDYETGVTTFGDPSLSSAIDEGTYYDESNPIIRDAVERHWPVRYRTYDVQNGATPWMPTGDSRTGLPFVLNRPVRADWNRVWLLVEDGEVVALDVAFPETGHDDRRPVYLLLHGLTGGNREGFVNDFTHRRTSEGSTVAVMIARGLMDLPVLGMDNFHGARVSDAGAAAAALRAGLADGQILAGVGFSMGAIILANYVSRSGDDCALDAAVAVSGGLDMRYETNFYRAQRLWQPILAQTLKDKFVLGKWGERVRSRLNKEDMKRLMRATHVTGIDETAVVIYHGFRDVDHYYSEMSLLGDTATDDHKNPRTDPKTVRGRIQNVSVPTLVIHSMDDPLVTWRTVSANAGLMHPYNLTRTGSGNLVLLLTKRGGHVGWPLGWFPFLHNWKWMNDAASSFVHAIVKARAMANHSQL